MKRLLEMFLRDSDVKALYDEVKMTGSEIAHRILNKRFNEFLFEVHFAGYVQKTMNLCSKKLYKESATLRDHEVCILNSTAPDSDVEWVHTYAADPIDFEEALLLDDDSSKTDDFFSDPDLIRALRKLTERQKLIIYLSFVKEKPLRAIASELGLPEKAVSKTKVSAIRALRKCKGASYGRAS